MADGLPDGEVNAALRCVDQPPLAGFEQYARFDGIYVWRRLVRDGLYEYKAVGVLDGISPSTCEQVYFDLDYRKTWDDHLKEAEEVPGMPGVLYWVVKYPWPMSSRDYVYRRAWRSVATPFGNAVVCICKEVQSPLKPERSGLVRVHEYRQVIVLAPVASNDPSQANRTRVYVHYFDNPGGSIPSSVISSVFHSTIPSFIQSFKSACKGYANYLDFVVQGGNLSASEQVQRAINDGLDKAFAGF